MRVATRDGLMRRIKSLVLEVVEEREQEGLPGPIEVSDLCAEIERRWSIPAATAKKLGIGSTSLTVAEARRAAPGTGMPKLPASGQARELSVGELLAVPRGLVERAVEELVREGVLIRVD